MADESEVRAALEQLKIGGLIEGKAGLFGRGKKDMGDHKVRFSNLRDAHRIEQHAVLGNATSASSWYIVSSCIITNLLINLRRGRTSKADGYIEPSVPREQVRQEPYPLPKDFEWSVVDLNDPSRYEHLCPNDRKWAFNRI